jgi:hypothetical protein
MALNSGMVSKSGRERKLYWTKLHQTAGTIVLACAGISFALGVPGVATGEGAWNLVSHYESGKRHFEEVEIGPRLVYFHQRMIGNAIVEKDYIVYQFDRSTEELLARKSHWRDDLPECLPAGLLSREQAESMVSGEVQFSDLYYISPESDVFPLETLPTDPCWVVRSTEDGASVISIIDACTGRFLGNGIPPPYTGFSLTGPWEFQPCSGAWTSWMNNAATWFETMGYSTEAVEWPRENKVRGHIQSGETAMFYELAHGGSTIFQSGCLMGQIAENTTAAEIETWIAGYAKMPFAFIGSCGGLCDTSDGSFSYEFRKGSAESTVTVGYCDMAEEYCSVCWGVSISWQTALFTYMNQGYSVREAFDFANADYPTCATNNCMRFAGDEDFAVVPVIQRDPWAPQVLVLLPNGGEVLHHGTEHELQWLVEDNTMIDSVTIVLSTDGGLTFPDTIAARTPNDSSFLWTVPDMDSKTARVKVVAVDAGFNEGSDLSDGDFTLWGTISGVDPPRPVGTPDRVFLHIGGGNPFSAGSEVIYGLPEPAQVCIDLYDVRGRLLHNLADGYRSQGIYTLGLADRWPDAPGPGMYFIRLSCLHGSATIKVVLTR